VTDAAQPRHIPDALHARREGRWTTLTLSLLALTLSAAYVCLQLSSPSDGARLEPGQQAWTNHGMVVTLLDPRPGELAPGDEVIAVDGRSMETWWAGQFSPAAPHPDWRVGQTVSYTVLRGGREQTVPVTLRPYPWHALLQKDWSLFLYYLTFAVVGTYVFIRRPGDGTATILFLGTCMLLAAYTSWSLGVRLTDVTGGLGFWLVTILALVVTPIVWAAFLHFVLRFPRVHPVLAGRRWLVPLLYLWSFPSLLAYLAIVRAKSPDSLAWIAPWDPGSNVVVLIYAALIALVLGSNVRAHLDAAATQQLRWIVFAGFVSVGSDLLLWIVPGSVLGHPFISPDALGLVLLPIPLALAIAILRYHVFDIDVLINKALVYGTLTATLATVYFGVVFGAEVIAQALTGESSLPPSVTVALTLLVAVLFTPVRRRVQALIDRRFYRHRYDAARTISAFGATLRMETDLDELSTQLVTVIEETMHPMQVSLWLQRRGAGKRLDEQTTSTTGSGRAR
jgi:hypothetical protein